MKHGNQETMITRAVLADAAEILALQKLAYQGEADLYGDRSIPPLTQTLAEIEAEFGEKVFLKAVSDNRITGSARAHLENGTCHIGRLIVDPARQGRGTGTALMREIERIFSGAQRFELFTGAASKRNIGLYRKLGYGVYMEKDLSPNVKLVFMEKSNTGPVAEP